MLLSILFNHASGITWISSPNYSDLLLTLVNYPIRLKVADVGTLQLWLVNIYLFIDPTDSDGIRTTHVHTLLPARLALLIKSVKQNLYVYIYIYNIHIHIYIIYYILYFIYYILYIYIYELRQSRYCSCASGEIFSPLQILLTIHMHIYLYQMQPVVCRVRSR